MNESVCSIGRTQDKNGGGAEKGSMFLEHLDNLFGLGPLSKRHENDGQLGREEEKKRREDEER